MAEEKTESVKEASENGGVEGEKAKELRQKKKEVKKEKEELSEEDLELVANLELLVTRLGDENAGVVKLALDTLINEIRTATGSMTSVPKPLKFLRKHYSTIKEIHGKTPDGENKTLLADVVSVLSIAYEDSLGDSLKYKLMGNRTDISTWGHEYVRSLAGRIGDEFLKRQETESDTAELLDLVKLMVPFHIQHNAEPEAIDLLLEVDQLQLLEAYVDEQNYERTCLYLYSCCSYLPEPADKVVLKVAFDIYMKVSKLADALRTAIRMNDEGLIIKAFSSCKDPAEKRQLGYLLARQGVVLDLEEGPAAVPDDEEREKLQQVVSNAKLSDFFLSLAKDLDVVEPKMPEDIYKSHLLEGRASSGISMDSARANLASTFVNGFVNAGYTQDKLLTGTADDNSVNWIFKNKEHGKMSASASLGLIQLWDVDGGLTQVDKYLYSTDSHVVAGALLAVGIISSNVRNECDPAFALLESSVRKEEEHPKRLGAIMGLGLAYAGSNKKEVLDLISEILLEDESNMEIVGYCALTIGLVFVGSCNPEAVQSILTVFMQRGEMELGEFWARFLCLGLGLLFLGRGDIVDPTVEVAKTFTPRVSKFCQVMLESCAYAGTGDVLKVQSLLEMCGEHIEVNEDDKYADLHQQIACLGIAMVAMGEELGSEMVMRSMEHMLQYGENSVRRSVPLALALLSVSNPQLNVVDTLSRLSHDSNSDTAQSAIIALGIVGAGSNNARLAGMLRSLTSYYYTEPSALFCVRVAQGLLHMGKGLMTLNPYHTHKQLLSNVALAGILPVLLCCGDLRTTIVGKHHITLFYLAAAMQPRSLMTLDEDGKILPVSVRVGQAVDVVGQAGRPKTITGFQTHMTPVLLGVGDRAELATEKYIAYTPTLEGFVILKENPDYVESKE